MAPLSLFTPETISEPTLLDRLFHRPRIDAATTALGNLLATSTPDAVTPGVLRDTLEKYHVPPDKSPTVAYRLVRRAYEAMAIRGGSSTDSDTYVAELSNSLGLAPDRVQLARQEATNDSLKRTANAILRSHRISPRDDAEFNARAVALGSNLTLADFASLSVLDRYREMWAAENGNMPEILVDIHLQRGEACHAVFDASWAEHRTETTRVTYSGYVASVRIVKGVRYRAGSYRPVRETRDVLRTLDSGRVFVTSKRVIFQGATLNKSITYSALIGIVPYTDGVELEKSSGKPPVLITDDAEYAAVMLGSAIGLA